MMFFYMSHFYIKLFELYMVPLRDVCMTQPWYFIIMILEIIPWEPTLS